MNTAYGEGRVKKSHKKVPISELLLDIGIVCFFVVLCITILYPFLFVSARSLSSGDAILSKMTIIPQGITFANYRTMLQYKYIATGFRNSVVRVALGASLNLAVCLIAAYPLSKRYLPHRTLIMGFIVFTMFFSGGLIPIYLLVSKLGLRNTVWALVLPTLIPTFSMIIMRNFFMTIPESLEESAKLDGARDITILIRLIIPVSKPVIATVALWSMVGHWNAWFDSMIYMTKGEKHVLQMIMRNMVRQVQILQDLGGMNIDEMVLPETLKAATVMLSTIPILLVYPFLQKYFAKGILIGSLKG